MVNVEEIKTGELLDTLCMKRITSVNPASGMVTARVASRAVPHTYIADVIKSCHS